MHVAFVLNSSFLLPLFIKLLPVSLLLAMILFWTSGYAKAQDNYSYKNQTNIFHVVKPRTLQQVNNELELTYTIDKSAIHFQLKVLKPESYVYRAQENDNEFDNEHVRLYIVSGNNERSAYVFGINHQSAYFDGIYDENSELSLDWNGQWDYSVEVSPTQWIATGSIPWTNLAFQSRNVEQSIQLLVSKHGNNGLRILSSQPSYIDYTGFFDNFTKIDIETSQTSKLEFFPYYSLNHSIADDNTQHNIGGEIFWQRSQNEHIDITFNPDFGQVESNDLIVNFSAIEDFFSEQRPFFTRNQGIFDVNGPETLRLLHTPRIGGSSFYEDVDARDIIGAGRYNFASGNASYSLLIASESDQKDILGRDFFATRAKINTTDGAIGISANFVNTPSLKRKSSVLGIDYYQLLSENFELSGAAVFSSIDAVDSTNDLGFWLNGNYQKNDIHLHEFTLFTYGKELELNDAGFVQRVDRKQLEYEYAMLFPDLNSEFIEELTINFEIEAKTNFDNEKLPLQIGIGTEFTSTDGAAFEVGIEWLSAGKDDNLTRDFNSTNLDDSWSIEIVYDSPEYPFGQIETEAIYGTENWSGRFYEATAGLNTELFNGLFTELEISHYQSASWLNWGGENNVDEFDFTETAIDLKLNYRLSEAHEFRIRVELIAGTAVGLSGNFIIEDGDRLEQENPDNFTFSEAAFQFRYKYTLTKLSAVYFSYTFGGEFEDEIIGNSKRALFSRAIEGKDNHGVFFKTRLAF